MNNRSKKTFLLLTSLLLIVILTGGIFFVLSKTKKMTASEKFFLWNKEKKTYEQVEEVLVAEVDSASDTKTTQPDYDLKNGVLKIFTSEKNSWQSPADWQVDHVVFADSTNNGRRYFNLSVWKPGNFGSSRPFWIEKNDQSVKNHFFILAWGNDQVKPVWQSSNLDAPNCEFAVADVDEDQKNELIVIEGSYSDKQCQGHYLAVWKWNGWGFSNEWRSKEGVYKNLQVIKIGAKKYITVKELK